MNTQKTAYWLALAVFALALHSEYQHGGFPSLHRASDRAGSTLCRIASRAEQSLAMARLLTSRPELSNNLLAAADARDLAETQVQFVREKARDRAELLRGQVRTQVGDQVRAQAEVIRVQAQLQRAQIEQIRVRTLSPFKFSQAANRHLLVVGPSGCAQSGVRIALNAPESFANSSDDGNDSF